MSITREQLKADVVSILRPHVPDEVPITGDCSVVGHLGLDSIALMEVIATIEDRFEVHISEAALHEMKTVEDILVVLEERLAAREGRT